MLKKSALAILYSPKTLIDFTWYYYKHGKDYKWDVLIIACDREIKIKEQCEKSGMFENIYFEQVNYDKISRLKQLGMFLQMFMFWMIGQKKRYVKRFFEDKGIELQYEKHLICSNFCSLDSGLLQCFADEIPTVVLEDGMSDYTFRTTKFDKMVPINMDSIIAYIMCKMNYASLNQNGCARYITKNSEFCDKYTIHPERMKYRKYRTINKLGETITNADDNERYLATLKQMYDVGDLNINGDVILFTAPLAYGEKEQFEISKTTVDYIIKSCSPKRVFLKKHPRDKGVYVFPQDVEVSEIPANIPAELIIDILDVKKSVFMYTTTVLLSMKSYDKSNLLIYDNLYSNLDAYKKGIDGDLETIGFPTDNIIRI